VVLGADRADGCAQVEIGLREIGLLGAKRHHGLLVLQRASLALLAQPVHILLGLLDAQLGLCIAQRLTLQGARGRCHVHRVGAHLVDALRGALCDGPGQVHLVVHGRDAPV
jgi:hypothetical protein